MVEGFHRGRQLVVVVVFMGLSFGILDEIQPILAITALTIIIYDIYENME